MKNKIGNLLIEICTEELPIDNLNSIAKDFVKYISKFLLLNNFNYLKINYYFSLRRISLLIYNISYYQNLKFNKIKIYGPKIKLNKYYNNLYKNNVLLWCKHKNINLNIIKYKDINNIRIFYYNKIIKQKSINFFIKKFLFIILCKLQKNNNFMRWGKNNFSFIRPINNIIIMFNKKVIKVKIFNIYSNNISKGHKFINNNNDIYLYNSIDYVKLLKKYGNVIVDFYERKFIINKKINKILFKNNLSIKYNKLFFYKLINLSEYPVVKLSKFNNKFLCLPYKVIYLILKNQNCLFTLDKNKSLTNKYIVILDNKLDSYKEILLSYNNVIESKLNDAVYLLINDRKKPLISFLINLKNIIFYENLGNYLNKVTRLLYLIKYINKKLNLNLNINKFYHSIILCKCDLSTSLYKEFNELKGFIGMYYSLLDKEDSFISLIIKEHYYPKNFIDKVPSNIYSYILSLCDKLDTLVGISTLKNFYYINKSNDPYELRRLSLCIIKIILFKKININLFKLIKYIYNLYINLNILSKNIKNYIFITNFILKRCIIYFLKLGYKKLLINCFINIKLFNILEIKNRMDFILFYNKNMNDEFKYILLINKRLKNIIRNNDLFVNNISLLNLEYKQDIFFYISYKFFFNQVNKFITIKNYYFLFKTYYDFSIKINNFLNNNKVHNNNNLLKNYRLLILKNIYLLFLKFMDFSYLYNISKI